MAGGFRSVRVRWDGETWVAVLADGSELLSDRRKDVVVRGAREHAKGTRPSAVLVLKLDSSVEYEAHYPLHRVVDRRRRHALDNANTHLRGCL
jgi:hypothetical protein